MPNAGKNQNYVVPPSPPNLREHSPENRGPLTCQWFVDGYTSRCENPATHVMKLVDADGKSIVGTLTCRTCLEREQASHEDHARRTHAHSIIEVLVSNDTPAPLLTEHSPARVDDFDLTPNYDALFDRFSRDIVAQPLLDLIQHDTDALHHFNSLMAALDIAIMSAHTTAQLAVVRNKVHAALGKASVAYQAALADDDAREEATEL